MIMPLARSTIEAFSSPTIGVDEGGEEMFQPQTGLLIRALPAVALVVGGLVLILLLFR